MSYIIPVKILSVSNKLVLWSVVGMGGGEGTSAVLRLLKLSPEVNTVASLASVLITGWRTGGVSGAEVGVVFVVAAAALVVVNDGDDGLWCINISGGGPWSWRLGWWEGCWGDPVDCGWRSTGADEFGTARTSGELCGVSFSLDDDGGANWDHVEFTIDARP